MPEIDSLTSRLQREIPVMIEEHNVPGAAIGICDRDSTLWSAGFGVLGGRSSQPVTTRTMFSLQSTSKMYTATAVMLAVQSGLVDLDSPITAYVPEFTVRSRWEAHPERRMTLRHLLAHTAGFTHEAPLGGNRDDRETSFEDHCRSITETWLRFPVGHHFEYSNLGIDLAGYILQRLSGLDFHEYVRTSLLEPLGLERTTFDPVAIADEDDRAIGRSSLPIPGDPPLHIPMVAAGGAYASVDDVLRYARFHLTSGADLLHPELLSEMYRVPFSLPGQRFGYGLGVEVATWDGLRVLNHGGCGFGFLGMMAWDPVSGTGVAVLTNTESNPLQSELPSRILREFAEDAPWSPPLPPAVPSTVSSAGFETPRPAGEYVGRGRSVRITEARGRLSLVDSAGSHTLRTVGPHEVVAEDDPWLRFRLVDVQDGIARYLINAHTGFTYYRNDTPPLDSATEDRYAIDLQGTEVESITILREGDTAVALRFDGTGLPPVRLVEHAPGLSFTSTGEALDLRTSPPTLANMALRPASGAPTAS